jgi:hypothetical protein
MAYRKPELVHPRRLQMPPRGRLREGLMIMSRRSDIDIVAHHDAQIDNLTTRMGHVEKTLSAHGTVLQEIRDVVVKQGARPSFDPRSTVAVVKDLGIIFGLVCTGILYLANVNATATVAEGNKDLIVLQERERVAQERLKAVESLVLPQSWQVTRK